MDIIPLGPGFAAELRGVTLADVVNDDAAYAAARPAFEEHSVLLFRGQEISGEGQLAFSRRFGPPEVTKVGSVGTGAFILLLLGDRPDEPLFLQLKEAQESVLAPFAGKGEYVHQGERVVAGQQLMQAGERQFHLGLDTGCADYPAA